MNINCTPPLPGGWAVGQGGAFWLREEGVGALLAVGGVKVGVNVGWMEFLRGHILLCLVFSFSFPCLSAAFGGLLL